jgi:hypothetical protein
VRWDGISSDFTGVKHETKNPPSTRRGVQLKSLLEKFRILHASEFLPYLCEHDFASASGRRVARDRCLVGRGRWRVAPRMPRIQPLNFGVDDSRR